MKEGIDQAAIERIGRSFQACWPAFNRAAFARGLNRQLEPLEMKARVQQVSARLASQLPGRFEQLAEILHELPHHWDYGDPQDALKGFAAWPVLDLVPLQGIGQPNLALPLLARLTHLFSSEFSVRPFIQKYPQQSLAFLEHCCDSPDLHVRRLASEGSRPLLPWGMQLTAIRDNPFMTATILEKLRQDPSKYVQKSVANHLNDMGKAHPDHLIATCKRWLAEDHPNSNWICRHALRGLMKQGDPRAFPLLGYDRITAIQLVQCKLAADTRRNQLKLMLKLHNSGKKPLQLRLDYGLTLPRANGKCGYFVFRWGDPLLQPDQQLDLITAHDFRPLTTRRYYAGDCRLDVRLNGEVQARLPFQLNQQLQVSGIS